MICSVSLAPTVMVQRALGTFLLSMRCNCKYPVLCCGFRGGRGLLVCWASYTAKKPTAQRHRHFDLKQQQIMFRKPKKNQWKMSLKILYYDWDHTVLPISKPDHYNLPVLNNLHWQRKKYTLPLCTIEVYFNCSVFVLNWFYLFKKILLLCFFVKSTTEL